VVVKKIFVNSFSLALLFFHFSVFGVVITWDNGGGDFNWNTALNWSGDIVPGPADDVQFNGGFTNANCVLNVSATVGSISFSTYTGDFNFSTNALTVTNNADFSSATTITAGSGQLIFAGGSAQNFTPKVGLAFPSVIQNGIGGTAISTSNLTATSLTVTLGSFTIPSALSGIFSGNLVVNGGTLEAGTGSLDVNGDVLISSGTFNRPNTGGTFTVAGSYDKTGGSVTWYNAGSIVFDGSSPGKIVNIGGVGGCCDVKALSFTGTGDWTIQTSDIVCTDLSLSFGTVLNLGAGRTVWITNLNITGGTLDFGSSTLKVNGDVNLSSLTTLIPGTGTLEFSNASSQIFAPKASSVHPIIKKTGSGLTTLSSNALITNGIDVSIGTLDVSPFAVTNNGDFTLSGGTVSSGNLTVSGSWSNSGGTFNNNSGSVTFYSTSTGNTINGGGSGFWNVTFDGINGDWTLMGSGLSAS
jgi:hypothetical protein